MAHRPASRGKHAARHKAPGRLARATQRIGGTGSAPGVRGTGGTVVALGAVVLAGAAGNGAMTGSTTSAVGGHAAVDLPAKPAASARADTATRADRAEADATRARAAQADDASRSAAREGVRPALAQRRDHGGAPEHGDTHVGTARAESQVPDDPRAVARQLVAERGWDAGEFSCLDQLWVSESDWQVDATNPTTGAYGIPQALPAEKMASAGSDWRTNPETQIRWGLRYIDLSYGTPCSAWAFKQANNWY